MSNATATNAPAFIRRAARGMTVKREEVAPGFWTGEDVESATYAVAFVDAESGAVKWHASRMMSSDTPFVLAVAIIIDGNETADEYMAATEYQKEADYHTLVERDDAVRTFALALANEVDLPRTFEEEPTRFAYVVPAVDYMPRARDLSYLYPGVTFQDECECVASDLSVEDAWNGGHAMGCGGTFTCDAVAL